MTPTTDKLLVAKEFMSIEKFEKKVESHFFVQHCLSVFKCNKLHVDILIQKRKYLYHWKETSVHVLHE